MAAPDPEDRSPQVPDAQRRWEERGNPPSQPVSKPLAFVGWSVWILAAVIAIAVVLGVVLLLAGVHAG